MKHLLLFLFVVASLSACKSSKDIHATQRQYFPESFKALYLGMPKADAMKARPNMEFAHDSEFRVEFLEKFENSDLTNAVYYFDDAEPHILYEIILVYKSEEARDKVANALLGTPNSENSQEWYFKTKEDFLMHCWTYKTKLILAGKIRGTEWEEPLEEK